MHLMCPVLDVFLKSFTGKINSTEMNKLFFLSGFCLLLTSNVLKAGQVGDTPAIPAAKKVIVYTTAENTNLRLTLSDTAGFVDFPQPLETQPCVFVDPTSSFRPLSGLAVLLQMLRPKPLPCYRLKNSGRFLSNTLM